MNLNLQRSMRKLIFSFIHNIHFMFSQQEKAIRKHILALKMQEDAVHAVLVVPIRIWFGALFSPPF